MITATEILEQAHATYELVHGECTDEFNDAELDGLWQFAFSAWSVAEEPKCSLQELEEEFNSPRGCPT